MTEDDCFRAALRAMSSVEPAILYVVLNEYQADTPSLIRAFLTEADAETFAKQARQDAVEEGHIIEGLNDVDDTNEMLDWTLCICVQPCPLELGSEDAAPEDGTPDDTPSGIDQATASALKLIDDAEKLLYKRPNTASWIDPRGGEDAARDNDPRDPRD